MNRFKNHLIAAVAFSALALKALPEALP